MKQSLLPLIPLFLSGVATAEGLTDSSLKTYVDALSLSSSFKPVKEAYWTGYPHHRRTPFAVSPSGTTAYLAYLDASETGVHIQPVDPATFKATGTVVTVPGGKEAGGLVAQDDGFALLTNEALPSGTANAPAGSTPVPVLYRFDASGTQKWKTWLGGPSVASAEGLLAAPDLNGDLVYSNATGKYAAYTVVTAYSGSANGHYGDAIRYVDESTGKIVKIDGASSDWGCSHNTGIALEAADEAPYASICAEDQGAIWLNTKGQGMTTVGVKVSNENTTNGASGEPVGGMSGSYSNLARFKGGAGYIFAWVSRGATDITLNSWMGQGYTHSVNRTNGRNVAIAALTDKYTLKGQEATSQVGAASGDSQVNWVTKGTADCSNAHAAVFDGSNALITWEEIADPVCDYIAMGCRGTFTGSRFQQVTKDGAKVGSAVTSTDVYVAGDMVTMSDGRICWPYVSMKWDLSQAVGYGGSSTTTTKMSFACASLGGAVTSTDSTSPVAASSAARAATSVAAASSSDVVVAPSSSSTEAEIATTSADLLTKTQFNAVKPTAESSSSSAAAADQQTTFATSVPVATPSEVTSVSANPVQASSTGSQRTRPTRRPCAMKRRQDQLAQKQ